MCWREYFLSSQKVKILEARNLAPLDRHLFDSTFFDVSVDIKFAGHEQVRKSTYFSCFQSKVLWPSCLLLSAWQRTCIIRKTCNPRWDEEFRFEFTDDSVLQNEPIEFKVGKSYSLFSNRGEVAIMDNQKKLGLFPVSFLSDRSPWDFSLYDFGGPLPRESVYRLKPIADACRKRRRQRSGDSGIPVFILVSLFFYSRPEGMSQKTQKDCPIC